MMRVIRDPSAAPRVYFIHGKRPFTPAIELTMLFRVGTIRRTLLGVNGNLARIQFPLTPISDTIHIRKHLAGRWYHGTLKYTLKSIPSPLAGEG